MSLFVAVEVEAVASSTAAVAGASAPAAAAETSPAAEVPSGVPGLLPVAAAALVPSPALMRSKELPRLSEVAAPAAGEGEEEESIDFFSSSRPVPPSTEDGRGEDASAFAFVAAFLLSSPSASVTRPSVRDMAAIMLLGYHGGEERLEGPRARGSLREEEEQEEEEGNC